MSVYKLATEHDNAEELLTVDPQPMSPGILYPERRYAADGSAHDHGTVYTVWQYSILTPAQYTALLTAFGLASAVSALVTVATVDDVARTTWSNYNARIVKPEHGKTAQFRRGFWRDVQFMLRELEALA